GQAISLAFAWRAPAKTSQKVSGFLARNGEEWRAISPGEAPSRPASSHHSRPASSTLARRANPEFGAQPRIWP
ncbi:hypothetical protein A2U01_0063650, partial [Trifolium medium]|nr:hypothetical protein [Trifolium medium]